MQIIVKRDHEEISRTVAEQIAAYINKNPGALINLAAGDTPLRAYELLIELQREGAVDLSSVYYVGLDEWVGLGYAVRGSCAQVMQDGFYGPAGIDPVRICAFDGTADVKSECERVSDFISAHGGIGLTVLGVGLNGHIGFNEPRYEHKEIGVSGETGLKRDSEETVGLCRIVDLDEVTRAVSVKYFDSPLPVEQGVTVSLETLADAKQVILMATGAKKSDIMNRVINGEKSEAVPASMLKDHQGLVVCVDEAVGL